MPLREFSFTVTIDGSEVPGVVEVSGLKSGVDKIELKQQTEDGKFVVRQIIGRPKAGEFTITRGLTGSATATLTDWLKTVMQGEVAGARKSVAVAIRDHSGETVKTFTFGNCWVRSVEIDSLKAGGIEPATEKFIICYDESTIS
ncbi:MAG TPA: phage tail protein [Glaciibacter sp.]|nr:phage tail protein [Glaciibacter sp.]